MGCDIHLFVEKKENGAWVSIDAWEPDEYDGDPHVPCGKSFYDARNYYLFAILANVRNGSRADIERGDSLMPICEPRDLPVDVSDIVRAESDRWGVDGHNHNWLTLQELLAYDWTQVATLRGWINGLTYYMWDSRGREGGPRTYAGSVTGGRVRHISEAEMQALIKGVKERIGNNWEDIERQIDKELDSVYCLVQWQEPYHDLCRQFWFSTMPRLLRVGAPEYVRIVFWFDN